MSNLYSMLEMENEKLQEIASGDTHFVSALYASFPDAAQHVGFDMFDATWIRNYGRQILRSIGRLRDFETLSWAEGIAINVAIESVAHDLLVYLHLPPTESAAAIALSILLAKGVAIKK